MSYTALTSGVEWNHKITDPNQAMGVLAAFEDLWNSTSTVNVDQDWIDEYIRDRKPPYAGGRVAKTAVAEDAPIKAVKPDVGPQTEALKKLEQTRQLGNESG